MAHSEQIKAVLKMQDYIHNNIYLTLNIDDICSAGNYSKWHALRMFKKLLSKTVYEYIRDLRLVIAATKLIAENSKESILKIALDAGYESHDGFTKAFCNRFGVLPKRYRKKIFMDYKNPIPMSCYYLLWRSKGMNYMNESQRTITATYVTKKARKLIIKRGFLSNDYFTYCDEIGCDIWNVLAKVPNALEKVSFVLLPQKLITEGTSKACCAIEVPLEYDLPIPHGCDIIHLEEQTYIWFQGMPYEDENWYGNAHTEIYNAINAYNPKMFGYSFAYNKAPEFFFGASTKDGCKQLVPVVKNVCQD